jgi:hypothetical protein
LACSLRPTASRGASNHLQQTTGDPCWIAADELAASKCSNVGRNPIGGFYQRLFLRQCRRRESGSRQYALPVVRHGEKGKACGGRRGQKLRAAVRRPRTAKALQSRRAWHAPDKGVSWTLARRRLGPDSVVPAELHVRREEQPRRRRKTKEKQALGAPLSGERSATPCLRVRSGSDKEAKPNMWRSHRLAHRIETSTKCALPLSRRVGSIARAPALTRSLAQVADILLAWPDRDTPGQTSEGRLRAWSVS